MQQNPSIVVVYFTTRSLNQKIQHLMLGLLISNRNLYRRDHILIEEDHWNLPGKSEKYNEYSPFTQKS
jgi:hypothetical protein